jgi:hypothetical protein
MNVKSVSDKKDQEAKEGGVFKKKKNAATC